MVLWAILDAVPLLDRATKRAIRAMTVAGAGRRISGLLLVGCCASIR
jgi:hypothetical protein